jgi:peptidoglycan/LPS O-acetylase OafA/YrhL
MKILIFLIFVFLGACTNGTEPTTTISKIDTAAATLALTTILSILQSDTIWVPTLKLQKIQTQDPALRASFDAKKSSRFAKYGRLP